MIVQPDAENRTIVSSFVWTKHRTWRTDGRTDGRIDSQPVAITARPHCKHCGRAVNS